MPAARFEQIVDAIKTRVTGLGLTGAHVFRGLDHDLQETQLPALEIEQGRDQLEDEYCNGLADWNLDVDIVAIAQDTSAALATSLNAIRTQVAAALLADTTLGLPWVIRCAEQGADEIERSGAGHKPTGRMRLRWSVRYRRSIADPTA